MTLHDIEANLDLADNLPTGSLLAQMLRESAAFWLKRLGYRDAEALREGLPERNSATMTEMGPAA